MKENFFFSERFDFSDVVGEGKIISFGIGPNNEAILLVTSAQNEKFSHRHEEKGFARFPLSRAQKNYPVTFFRFNGRELLQKTELAEIETTFPKAQPLPNEEILLVGLRCDYRDGDPEKNAVVYAKDGKILRQFVLGDGINDVQTTNDGLIWVSYFDEGVFGNFGWNEPMGSSGLNCFNSTGQLVWQFQPPDRFDSICDCYSLNVAQDTAWACYYTDFPLVKIDSSKQVEGWKNEICAANALAVNSKCVLFWGGYQEQSTRCVLQNFGDQILIGQREISLNLPDGLDIDGANIIGRGSILHAFAGKKWLSFDINSI